MATPPSDDTRTMFKLIADGEWHNYQQVKAAIAATVPPGRALRKYQQRLQESRDIRRDSNTEVYRSEDEQIRLGAMSCAQVTLTSWKGKGIIVRGEGTEKQVKVKPGFHSWGIVQAPVTTMQDPAKQGQGYTDLPPRDSEPFEARGVEPQEASAFNPEPQAEPEPEPASMVELDALTVMQPSPVGSFLAAAPDSALVEGPKPAQQWVPPADSPFAAVSDVKAGPGDQPAPSQWVTNVPVQICSECSMAVTDLAAHEQWHAELKAEPGGKEFALVDREAMVTLVGDVTRQVLDEFQVGLQDWFEERFAELERQIFALRGTRLDRSSWTQKP